MKILYEIDKDLLKQCRGNGQCVCKLDGTKCPCDDFLEKDECQCGAFKRLIKEES